MNPQAVAGMLIAAVAVAAAPLPTRDFAIAHPSSSVEFFVRDNRGGFTGRTTTISGTVAVREIVREQVEGYAAEVTARIDARTIRTGVGLRDGQMRSAQFLNTDEFPFITFRGTATAAAPEGRGVKGLLRGRLTIKEVTRMVEVPLEITVEDGDYLARGEVVVRMTDFGLPIPRFLIFVAEDPVRVNLQIRVTRAPRT
ncbi:MAG TPA: YceI family protein [bacterium]|nr:YceI family protein [bacterium]